jgi:shikimate dehydrogenase
VPLKQAVIPYVKPDVRARAIGAVNTIDFRDNTGTNTDVVGFIEDLQAHGLPFSGARAIVLGAGGAARAAVYGLSLAGARVTVVNRTIEKAQVMLADLALSSGVMNANVQPLERALEGGVSLIVNCTSVGMWPKVEESPWPEDVPFPAGAAVYDMVYRPERTRLLAQAEAAGCRAIGGLGMLVRQGAAAFTIWTRRPAPVEIMFEAAREALKQN